MKVDIYYAVNLSNFRWGIGWLGLGNHPCLGQNGYMAPIDISQIAFVVFARGSYLQLWLSDQLTALPMIVRVYFRG